MSNPILLTVCTDNNAGLQNLLASLSASGWSCDATLDNGSNVRVLGYGQKWKGYETKMKLYSGSIEAMHDDQLVLCMDANDILCRKFAPSMVADAIRDIAGPSMDKVVAGMEKIATPINGGYLKRWLRHKRLPTSVLGLLMHHYGYPFCNSGMMAGKASAFKRMYRWIASQNFQDDQLALAAYANTFPDQFEGDMRCRMFYNASFLETTPPSDAPLFVHYPGYNLSALACLRKAYNAMARSILGHRAIPVTVNRAFQGCVVGGVVASILFAIVLIGILWHRKKATSSSLRTPN